MDSLNLMIELNLVNLYMKLGVFIKSKTDSDS